MRHLLAKLTAWAFSRVIYILRLSPGDVLVVYDPEVLDLLAAVRNVNMPFQIPLIDGYCIPGEEHEILRKLSFEEFNKVWNMAYHSYAEAQWKIAQETYYFDPPYPSLPSQDQQKQRSWLGKWKVVGSVVALGQKLKELLSGSTSPKPGLSVGQGESQPTELLKKQGRL